MWWATTPKGVKGYQPDVPYYTFNLDKAKQELALAAPENRAMVEKGIKITYALGYAIGKEGLMMWKSDLVKIGVNLILDEQSVSAFNDIIRTGGAPIVDGRWLPDFPDPATYYQFLDLSYFKAEKFGTTPDWISGLLQKAAFETNPDERLKIYRQVEEWAYESSPYIKVASRTGVGSYNVRGAWVKGYESHIFQLTKPVFYELWKELPTEGGQDVLFQRYHA